uniref:Uncharacterized protein n=1 Tax=Anguilla anguilla TaxID=7936 RepID=A0A0E9UQQ9_ANGAN
MAFYHVTRNCFSHSRTFSL